MARKSTRTTRNTASAPTPETSYTPANGNGESPYSLSAVVRFFNDNAGLIFIGLSLFIAGFLAGSMWTENNLLRKGTGVPTAQVQPTNNQLPTEPAAGPLSDADWKAIQEKPAGVVGNKNAPVTMVEFTDYQCPFCERHYTQTYGQIKKDYVDTGKVKIVFKDQPLTFHPNSRIGALAARCGNDQGKFEAMHDALFANQATWVNLAKEDAINKFGDLATTAGLNGNALKDCVRTEKHGAEVDADAALGSRVGAGGTPTFFIEKETLVGAMPYESFKAVLDKYVK